MAFLALKLSEPSGIRTQDQMTKRLCLDLLLYVLKLFCEFISICSLALTHLFYAFPFDLIIDQLLTKKKGFVYPPSKMKTTCLIRWK
jgi:hypothetical protein